ncbi:MAG: LLM class flavin-dependent oxidoreductase [Thermomicrobiales bacterium]
MVDPVTTAAPLGRWPKTDRPMGIGVMLPLLDGGAFGGQPRFRDVLEMAQTVEACGFDGIWMPIISSFATKPTTARHRASGSVHDDRRGGRTGTEGLDRRAGDLPGWRNLGYRRQDGRE